MLVYYDLPSTQLQIGGETVAVGDAADAVDGDAGDDAPTQGILERMEENPDQSLGDILKQVAADKAKEKASGVPLALYVDIFV